MSAVDTRNISRDSLFLMATLRAEGSDQDHKVKVRNLSSGGMMAESELRLTRGARVSIELRNIGWVSGAVAWVQDSRCGIAFDEEIEPKLARASVNTSGDLSSPRFVRPASIHPTTAADLARLRKI
ncbi:PilZ domain-containing protein [Altererythrobacter sp. H2]|uniref:PilZ domain-containing protein n=1 Tax=Altererythrobacter sp. H2 TaxID=3108391 RepID=UPI000BD5FCAD|nr:PilZ domain-containing protein [Altererythrobacter sp. H2]OZA92468.1 MAG: pilus assembly protein PilZ [Erythrobacter sp. 34-65-8]WRK96357.1 PilZ domain-containing protein [Altererythrobacter sp. H2]